MTTVLDALRNAAYNLDTVARSVSPNSIPMIAAKAQLSNAIKALERGAEADDPVLTDEDEAPPSFGA